MNTVTAWELAGWLKEGENAVFLVDVREEWERANYNIGGMHLPVGEIMSRKAEIPKDRKVVIYCEKGIRSGIVIQRLEGFGFEQLYNLTGGMSAWRQLPDQDGR